MAPVPRAQKANTRPTQCQDTTTTIKQQSRTVGGALRFHCQEWRKLTDNPWIIQCTQGYHLELIGTPPENYPVLSPRRPPEQSRVLEREVQDLLAKDAIKPTTKSGFFSPMFVVPKKDGGWRPIINLRKLNAFLSVFHFKMENINSVRDVIQENDYMGKIDLKDAYLTVPVWEKHRKYLKFAWGGQCYQFKSLPFGLATAPRTFTKLLRPVAAEMRRKGVRLVLYLDDILVMAQTREGLKEHLSQIASVLQSLGFTLNQQKCVWEPTRRIEFLGFIVDSETQMISLPRDKISKIRKECKSISGKDRVTGRQLAQIIDLLSSAIPAILPAPLHYRALQRLRCQALQQSQGDYESTIHFSTEAQRDLHWWIHNAPHCNGRPIPAPTADLVITSDASKTG